MKLVEFFIKKLLTGKLALSEEVNLGIFSLKEPTRAIKTIGAVYGFSIKTV